MTEHVDVLIVGAGLSGIGAAHHLQTSLPGKTYAICCLWAARSWSGGKIPRNRVTPYELRSGAGSVR